MFYKSILGLSQDAKLKSIVGRVNLIHDKCVAFKETCLSIRVTDHNTFLSDSRDFLSQFAGDAALIDYANQEALSVVDRNGDYLHPRDYDVQNDFAAIMLAITGAIEEGKSIDLSNTVSFDESGRVQYETLTVTDYFNSLKNITDLFVV